MDLRRIHRAVHGEVEDAARRARAAGAEGELQAVGAGQYGIVFCDETGRAYKVLRNPVPENEAHQVFLREALRAEYEWLRDAASSTEAGHVARVHGMDLEHLVLVRDCVAGDPGGWSDEGELYLLHRRIGRSMMPLGWLPPEFKGDSYIMTESGPVLVDASSPIRIGQRFVEYVNEVLSGQRETHETPYSLACQLMQEIRLGRIPGTAQSFSAQNDPAASSNSDVQGNFAWAMLDRLARMDPSIRSDFSMSGKGAESAWIRGRRFEVDLSMDKKKADLKDSGKAVFTTLSSGDMADLRSTAEAIRAGKAWERFGRFSGDVTGRDGIVVIDHVNGRRLKNLSTADVAELLLITEKALTEMDFRLD